MQRPALLGLLLAVACHGGDDGADATATESSGTDTGALLAPDFQIPDQNPASPTYARLVSPRDHLGHATGWFFLHST